MEERDTAYLLIFLKALLSTFGIIVLSLYVICPLIGSAFPNMSVEQSNVLVTACMWIGTLFSIFICAFTILDKMKKNSP
ncbi:MAG TPA: hypothetical protein VN426_17625 [Syntrophomonadaceae bacterium]|nr:hypothetical protein [Syntrophomonadaceae bacterium]